jgi:hypothetical protein
MTWREFKISVERYQGLDDEMEVGWINWNSPDPTNKKERMPHVVFINDYEAFIGERDKMEGE